MNIALLDVLRSHPAAFFTPEMLSRSLGEPVPRVIDDLERLEQFGFGLERVPNRGVRYTGPAARLCPDQIEWQLGTRTIGRRLAVWNRVSSTNDVAARAAVSSANDGLVVLAEEQTAGRGRGHRRWVAPPRSSILMSVLLFPPPGARQPRLLTAVAAVAVAEMLRSELGLPAVIKWPNDVCVNGRKLCGVLVEELARRRPPWQLGPGSKRPLLGPSGLTHLPGRGQSRPTVVGIGLNVNVESGQLPPEIDTTATALSQLCGRSLDRSELARSLIQGLDNCYQSVLSGNARGIMQRWSALGRPVSDSAPAERPTITGLNL